MTATQLCRVPFGAAPVRVPTKLHYTLTFWTSDVDGVFARALAAGATEVTPVADSFTGDRMGILRCPFGVRWCVARHDRDVPPEEIAAIAAEWSSHSAQD